MKIKCPHCNTEFEHNFDIYEMYGDYHDIGETYEPTLTSLFLNYEEGAENYISEGIPCPHCETDLDVAIALRYIGLQVREVKG